MGSIFVIVLAMPIVVLIEIALINHCPCKCGLKENCFYKYVRPYLRKNLKDLFWNGVLEFLDHSYLVLLLMAQINITDLRVGQNYSFVENLNSLLSIFWLIFAIIWPILIVALYARRIETVEPLPDLIDGMTIN